MSRVEIRDALVEAARDHDYVTMRYSGRAMYGQQCLAVKSSSRAFTMGVRMALSLEENNAPEAAKKFLLESRQDDLGGDTLIYWPDVPPPDKDSDDEGDDDE